MVVIGVAGLAIAVGLERLEAALLPWQARDGGERHEDAGSPSLAVEFQRGTRACSARCSSCCVGTRRAPRLARRAGAARADAGDRRRVRAVLTPAELADHVGASLWRILAGFALARRRGRRARRRRRLVSVARAARAAARRTAAADPAARLDPDRDRLVRARRAVEGLRHLPRRVLSDLHQRLARHGARSRRCCFARRARWTSTGRRLLWKVALPAALPDIATGLRVGFGLSFGILVAAELIAAERGMGFLVMHSRQLGQLGVAVFGILLIGVVTLVGRPALALALGDSRKARWVSRAGSANRGQHGCPLAINPEVNDETQAIRGEHGSAAGVALAAGGYTARAWAQAKPEMTQARTRLRPRPGVRAAHRRDAEGLVQGRRLHRRHDEDLHRRRARRRGAGRRRDPALDAGQPAADLHGAQRRARSSCSAPTASRCRPTASSRARTPTSARRRTSTRSRSGCCRARPRAPSSSTSPSHYKLDEKRLQVVNMPPPEQLAGAQLEAVQAMLCWQPWGYNALKGGNDRSRAHRTRSELRGEQGTGRRRSRTRARSSWRARISCARIRSRRSA